MPSKIIEAELYWLPTSEVDDIFKIIVSEKKNEARHRCSKPLKLLKKCYSCYTISPKLTVKDIILSAGIQNMDEKQNKNRKNFDSSNVGLYSERMVVIFLELEFASPDETIIEENKVKFIEHFCSSCDESDNIWLKIDVSSFKIPDYTSGFTYLRFDSFSLGNLVGLNIFVDRFDSKVSLTEHKYKITQVQGEISHDREKIYLYFIVGKKIKAQKRNSLTHCMHQLSIPYASIRHILISNANNLVVYLKLDAPPLLYKIMQEQNSDSEYTSLIDNGDKKFIWLRTPELYEGCTKEVRDEFSMNTVIKLVFTDKKYASVFDLVNQIKSTQIYFSPVATKPYSKKTAVLSVNQEYFEPYYALKCLLSRSFEVYDQMFARDEFTMVNKFLKTKCEENEKALTEALLQIYKSIDSCNIVIFSKALESLYKKYCIERYLYVDSINQYSEVKSQILMVKHAVLTPAGARFLPPQPALMNRALRNSNPKFSLRIKLRDLNLQTLNHTIVSGFMENKTPTEEEFVQKYVLEQSCKGIQIGKRKYLYTASSQSQFKSHGLWFYAKDDTGRSSNEIRNQIGNMEGITKTAKYMARMGQTFSQAMTHITVPHEHTNIDSPEEDITGGEKKYIVFGSLGLSRRLQPINEDEQSTKKDERYIFSDGVGRISEELANKVYEKVDTECQKPSAMQIRYAGCKGMLVVYPQTFFPKDSNVQIIFRDSMRKFKSSSDSLEILKLSDKRISYLNRPLITILEQLGISKEVFSQLQTEMINRRIKSMFRDEEARDVLNNNALLRLNYSSMYTSGIKFNEDPLFSMMIRAIFVKEIELLKTKTRIEIPTDCGRVMFGVVDETFTLNYGEVFVQYSDWKTNELKILSGPIVVTKNPCMYPGDVRKLKAVDVEALHHIYDCIVFPAQGERPHPDEMAGSDLDGDEYQVIWHKSLMFVRNNLNPAHFAVNPKEKLLLDKNIPRSDDVEEQKKNELTHVCNFILYDKVGLFANAHLAYADFLENGIFDDKCDDLAKKYTISLDFAKSGISVKYDYKDMVPLYPDFMGKHEHKTYLSKKALGYLYRDCKLLETELELTVANAEYLLDEDLVFEGWEKYKKSAEKYYKMYSSKVRYYIRTYGLENEGVLLSGAIYNITKLYDDRHDFDNLIALLEYEARNFFYEIKKDFFKEFGGIPSDGEFTTEMMQKASAWYIVSYRPKKSETENFFGLPWTVADVLIAMKFLYGQLASTSKKTSIVEQIINEYIDTTSITSSISSHVSDRLKKLECARVIIKNWIQNLLQYFASEDSEKLDKCIDQIFSQFESEIEKYTDANLEDFDQDDEVISPGFYIIETLLRLSVHDPMSRDEKMRGVKRQLQVYAWNTLIKLRHTKNLVHLGISYKTETSEGNVAFIPGIENTIEETIKIPVYRKERHSYEDVIEKLVENGFDNSIFSEVIINNIELSDRREPFLLKLTVKGKKVAIERLKYNIMLQDLYGKL